jgi:hypothetical protein
MDKEQQHVIPKGYLYSWVCLNPPPGKLGTMWVIQKDDRTKRRLESPKKYFREKDRYTLKTQGGRNLAVEDTLGMVEAGFGEALPNLIARKPLTGYDRVKIAFFVSAMMLRTNRLPGAIRESLDEDRRQAMKLEAKEKIESSFSDAIANASPDIPGDTLRFGLNRWTERMVRMKLSVFVTDDEDGFATGDEPCCVSVPGQWNAFPAHPDVEITMPLTPHHMAYYSWKYAPMMYVPWDRKMVDRINARTVNGCNKEFVSLTGNVRPQWFCEDLPPEYTMEAAN